MWHRGREKVSRERAKGRKSERLKKIEGVSKTEGYGARERERERESEGEKRKERPKWRVSPLK